MGHGVGFFIVIGVCHVWLRSEKDRKLGPALGKGGRIKMGKTRSQLTRDLGKPLVPEKLGMGPRK